ncbi:MAG: asparagine synthase-related protein [Ardenticatenaceae bacterium]
MSIQVDEKVSHDLDGLHLVFHPSSMRSWVKWESEKWTIYVTGWAFADHLLLGDESLAQYIIRQTNASQPFSDILHHLNGNFAVLLAAPEAIHLGVDLVRTIPLFYRQEGSTLLVSDDIRQIQRDDDTIEQNSLIEMATAGYVTGPHTLFAKIKGLQSGECVSWSKGHPATERTLQSQRYYEYLCSYDATSSVETLCEEFDEMVIAAFTRIIETLNGRQVLLPLSGGLDSRLVAATLKRLGYDNVLCFSYGIPGNRESVRSQQVAKALGYDWLQTPYSAQLLKEALNSPKMREYRAFAANAVSLPHQDDWLAIRILRDHSEVHDDAILMPGHTGDFICGSHLKYIFDPVWHDDPYALNEAMIKKHYSHWEDLVVMDHIRAAIEHRLDEALGAFPNKTHQELACMYEYWEWQERQAKYIINALRVYDFFGFSWRMPLWDRAIVDFWKPIPISLKMDKYLYRSYLASHDPMGVFQEDAPTGLWHREPVIEQKRGLRQRIKENLQSNRLLSPPFYHYQKLRRHLNAYRSHPLGFARAYGAFRYICQDLSKRHMKALLVREFLLEQYKIDFAELRQDKSTTAG